MSFFWQLFLRLCQLHIHKMQCKFTMFSTKFSHLITKMGKMDSYTRMENQQNIFSDLFLNFVFTLLEAIYWYLLLNKRFNKSYVRVFDMHSRLIVKKHHCECFQAILYLTFICYNPVYLNFIHFCQMNNFGLINPLNMLH